jgi:alpha-beta hydrolase superfamily lysophospholipase
VQTQPAISLAPPPPGWAKAAKRAMSIARLTGNGMDHADALELHALVDAGVAWHHGAERLGDRNLGRARDALVRGHRHSARSWFLLASACFRFGQVVLTDADPRKRALYRRMLDAFGQAGELHEPRFERIEVPWRHGTLSGWRMRARPPAPGPVVIQMCGIGGSREEYEVGCRYLLERGISAVLIDAPGQGETRLFGGLHLDEHVIDAIAAIVDVVVADPGCDGRIGLWGNSAGGWLAAHAAAADPRVGACCVVGGTDRPTEIVDRFPRFMAEVQQMTGRADPDEARDVLHRMALGTDRLRRLRCPLAVVHGTPDRVFRVEGARRIHDGAGSPDKTLIEFADGDHCVTNRSHEKHTLVADWFADRLARPA